MFAAVALPSPFKNQSQPLAMLEYRSMLTRKNTRQRHRTGQGAARTPAGLLVMFGLGLAIAPATAQQLPGLVLAPGPSAQPAPPQAPPAAAKPKPKPKPNVASADDKAATDSSGAAAGLGKGGSERIIMLVNDVPITAREVDQRARFLGASSNVGPKAQEIFNRMAKSEAVNNRFRETVQGIIKANQGKIPDKQIMAMIEKKKAEFGQSLQQQALEQARGDERPKYRQNAIEEIIEEKLKLQEAKKAGIDIKDEEVNRIVKGIAERNHQTEAQFAEGMKRMGVDISTMRARFRASFAWREAVRKNFGAQIQIIEPDIERLIAAQASGKGQADTQELEVQRIVFTLPGKLDQGAMAHALADADALRRKYGGCKSMAALTKDQTAARFEPAKFVKPSTIGEPSRSMLIGAKDGELLPPQTSADGVELMVVCSRRALKIDDKQREAATQELQSKQFEELATQRLRELRREANIERRE